MIYLKIILGFLWRYKKILLFGVDIFAKLIKNKMIMGKGNKVIGAMSPETEKMLDSKLKFRNTWVELGDGYLIRIIDNKILSKMMEKLTLSDAEMIRGVLAEVIDEMPEIEI